jgi:hypothetical protein
VRLVLLPGLRAHDGAFDGSVDVLRRSGQVRGPVRVDWVDALFELDGNGSPPDSFDVETYGWIVGQNQTFVTVAGERLPDGQYRAITHIPAVLIEHIQDLYEGS